MPEAGPGQYEHVMPRYGSYQVLHPLGSGGMSSVYRAVHLETGHEFALKVLPVHLAKNPIVLQRFMREARSAESLQHPSIVSIYDRGVDLGRYYLVLEYVDGMDLHGYVQTRGPLGVAEAVAVIRQVAEGLRYAAGQGLVHRDIKPSNILRSHIGEIKITDLGLALQWEFEDERVTREGTTVGTVDYMAPEQARDSRAAGPVSDQYSLGCTAYYLLTGIPPFPGGDITDKLTRHAQSPPPDPHDLRPDVPPTLSSILLRMMAKRAEDRFPSFDELIRALEAVPLPEDVAGPAVALAPLESPGFSGPLDAQRSERALAGLESRPPSSIPEISLANLPHELLEPPAIAGLPTPPVAGASLSRSGAEGFPWRRTSGTWPGISPPRDRSVSTMSAAGWISLCVSVGVGFILLVIAIDQVVRPSQAIYAPAARAEQERDHGVDVFSDRGPEAEMTPRHVAPGLSPAHRAGPLVAIADQTPVRIPAEPPRPWVEPEDPGLATPPAPRFAEEDLKKYLPPWALSPIPSTVEGPKLVVRRVPGPGESTLRNALDEIKGSVELADVGPFLVNDLRIPGESRLIRARSGLRSILRIDRPLLEIVRSLPGVFMLEGKSLVLDSLDLIVNVRDLSPTQGALFYCAGTNLTLRDCTITVVNASNQPFSLVRVAPGDTRGCKFRFENSFVRGTMSQVFDLGRGSADIVLRDSFLLGSQGPIVRSPRSGPGFDQRLWCLGTISACRGPGIELTEGQGPTETGLRPLQIRSLHSVFGRFQVAGIASLVSSTAPITNPRNCIDWAGDRNLFCGWKGFFATGTEPTLVQSSLAEHRSTWNGSEGASQSIPVGWPQPQLLDQSEPGEWVPFVPGWESTLSHVARSRPFLAAKTLWGFPPTAVPVPLLLGQTRKQPWAGSTESLQLKEFYLPKLRPGARPVGPIASAPWPAGGPDELVFDADAPDWHGDLGAFLASRIPGGARRIRVRVKGSGPRRTSPVRLPDGLVIEIRVDPPTAGDAGWLSWTPEPESSGRALFELHEGTLVLSEVRLRDDSGATLESLIAVEEGDLILHRCQLSRRSEIADRSRPLLSFRARTTRPRTESPPGIFATPPDRNVCILAESTLIATGTAIHAELGRGTLAMAQCAVAAGGDVLRLVPSRVARTRFVADLVLEECTLASEMNLIHLAGWPGTEPGPDRPWLIQTERCAFLGTYDRRSSETVLLRSEPEAMARGLIFCQGRGDAIEVDRFTALDGDLQTGRIRDVVAQWVNFWGGNHQREITGPRAGSIVPSVRLLERPKPGHVEPADLCLDPTYHPYRSTLDVGADLARQGIVPRLSANARRR